MSRLYVNSCPGAQNTSVCLCVLQVSLLACRDRENMLIRRTQYVCIYTQCGYTLRGFNCRLERHICLGIKRSIIHVLHKHDNHFSNLPWIDNYTKENRHRRHVYNGLGKFLLTSSREHLCGFSKAPDINDSIQFVYSILLT